MLQKTVTAFIIAVLLFLPAAFVSTAEYEGLRIDKVLFEGNEITKKELLKTAVLVKAGDTFRRERVSDSIRELYKLNLFSFVSVDVVKDKDGNVTLTFRVKEFPLIKTVKYEGMKKVSPSDIEEDVKKIMPEESVLSPDRVRQVEALILGKYREEGLLDAAVSVVNDLNLKDGSVTVTFVVSEGVKTIVKSVRFTGNKAFTEKKIAGRMETKPKDWLHAGIYDPDKYSADLEKIMDFYKDNGHIKAQILSDRIATNIVTAKSAGKKKPVKETRELSITIDLSEGDQYIFDGYRVKGFSLFTPREIEDLLRQKVGEPFNQSQFMKDIIGVQQLYAGRGYIFAQVLPEDKINETNRTISFDVTVEENEIAHVENIIISGNAKTKEYVVRRELSIAEGDIFDADKIRRSQEKIYNLGFFKDVKLDWKPGSAPGLMNLVLDLEEQQTGMITLGATIGADQKGRLVPGGYEEISENNFLGRGYRIHERIDIAPNKQNYEAGFSSPWIFNTPTSFGADLYYRDQVIQSPTNASQTWSYFNKEAGLSIVVGRQFNDYSKAGGGYNFQWYSNSDVTGAMTNQVEEGSFLRNLLSFYYEFDSRDNVFNPRKGWHVRPGFETSIGFAGNDTYNKYTLDASFYVPGFWKTVLVLHSYTGVIDRSFFLPHTFQVADRDKFILGSPDTIRGYTGESGRNRDGKFQWDGKGLCQQYFNVELRFPIAEQLLWSLLFVDAGNMWSDRSKYSLNMKNYGYSAGIGFRVQIPMLPLRLYWSYKFGYEDGTGFYIKNVKNKAGWYPPSFDISVYGLF